MGRANKYPRSHEKFVGLPHVLVVSAAWRSLRGSSIKVFIEICDRYNGANNGEIHLGGGSTAKTLHLSKATVFRALEELAEKGFIERTAEGNWLDRRAATWRLTHRPDNRPNGSPIATHEWRHWDPLRSNGNPSKKHFSVPE